MESFAPRLLAAIAAELRRMNGDLEAVGARLAADPAMLARHAPDLQAFDLHAQLCREIAAVLEATGNAVAVQPESIGIEALRLRLWP